MCPEKTVIYYSETEARANLLFICRACMMELATIILAVRRILAKAKA